MTPGPVIRDIKDKDIKKTSKAKTQVQTRVVLKYPQGLLNHTSKKKPKQKPIDPPRSKSLTNIHIARLGSPDFVSKPQQKYSK